VAHVSIPFTLNKIDDKREWYYLRNQKDENIISILVSIYCDYKDKNSSVCDTSYIISKSTMRNDISCDNVIVRKDTNNNYANIINSKSNNSFSDVGNHKNNNKYIEIKDQFINNSHYSPNCKFNYSTTYNKTKNLDNTVLYNENYKSPDLSVVTTNNLFSPYSYRLEEKVGTIKNFEANNNVMDSFIENKLNDINLNNKDECYEVLKRIKEKYGMLKDEQERNSKLIEEINREKESI
jgi:hypothetical protein